MNILTITPEINNINVNTSSSTGLLSVSTSGNNNVLTNIYPIIANVNVSGTTQVSNISVSGINTSSNIVNIISQSVVSSSSSLSGVYTAGGRLSLISNNPINNSNISSGILYYTPYLGNKIGLYVPSISDWVDFSFSEVSLSLSGSTPSTIYDIFIYHNGNNIVLEKINWASNSTRNIPIILNNGIYVSSTNSSKRYIGSIMTTTASTTEDSESRRLVWNYNNPIYKKIYAADSTLHTYTTQSYRPYRNSTNTGTTKAEFINGLSNNTIFLSLHSDHFSESNFSSVALGVDSLVPNTDIINGIYVSFGSPHGHSNISTSTNSIYPSIGYHYLQVLQYGSTVSTFNKAILSGSILC